MADETLRRLEKGERKRGEKQSCVLSLNCIVMRDKKEEEEEETTIGNKTIGRAKKKGVISQGSVL